VKTEPLADIPDGVLTNRRPRYGDGVEALHRSHPEGADLLNGSKAIRIKVYNIGATRESFFISARGERGSAHAGRRHDHRAYLFQGGSGRHRAGLLKHFATAACAARL
jgi:hypothetical protein